MNLTLISHHAFQYKFLLYLNNNLSIIILNLSLEKLCFIVIFIKIMKIWLADLTYTQQSIASDVVPAAIGSV